MFTTHPQSRSRRAQVKVPLMVVRFPTLHLAFDMAQLQQVIPMPVVEYNATQLLGLAMVDLGQTEVPDQRKVIVVDLHRKLYDASLDQPSHLLLFKGNNGLLYGVPVATLPEIVPIDADLLLDQEDDVADRQVVGITRQVVKLPGPGGERTLFVVEANSLAQEVRNLAGG
ncbi:hypothetical protein IQ266_09620 [filamentous cyanobacterium LEGE 11480]|uniref:CheW-like domain-containing protein n=1 Tax=Romeriopsis navalis LEGE 11480 TaxID=2777977 RepID=A0A928VPY6_9CYAN|nr:hypothetical protein [Romeriopsis navalis]MBE9029984.1 hypothetical protein [Romeriopsis navalis LEGE 11480]